MNEIIVINDDSTEALNAAVFAAKLAKAVDANIVLANVVRQRQTSNKMQLGRVNAQLSDVDVLDGPPEDLKDYLTDLISCWLGFQPAVTYLDVSGLDEWELAKYINSRKVHVVVEALNNSSTIMPQRIDVIRLLNNISCPALLVPPGKEINLPEKAIYLTDLRYCQQHIIGYLRKLGKNKVSILLAHACEKGLVDLHQSYADQLFDEVANLTGDISGLFYASIKQKDIAGAIDGLIDIMNADMLVCVKRQFQAEYLDKKWTNSLPNFLTIPMLVFPF